MMRNWRVEDNLVTLYIAKHKYKNLKYESEEIEKIISHKGFDLRVKNFGFIVTGKGLSAGGPAESWKQLYNIFKDFDQKKFAELVNLILKVKSNLTPC
jgi:hypothetical protein